MGVAGVMRRIWVLLAAAGLCAVIGGCASDVGVTTSKSGSGQLRYYGGPKYPMWPSQQ
jgi:uncharacterized protein YceK